MTKPLTPTAPTTNLRSLTLDQLMDEEMEYSAVIKQAEEYRSQIKAELLRQLTETGFQVGQSFIRADGVSANIQVRAGNKRIDRQALILAGVDETIVDDATIQNKPSAPFVVVYPPKGHDANGFTWATGTTETSGSQTVTRRS